MTDEPNITVASELTPASYAKHRRWVARIVIIVAVLAVIVMVPRWYFSSQLFQERATQVVGEFFREGQSLPVVTISRVRPHGVFGVELRKIDVKREYPPFAAISIPSIRATSWWLPALLRGRIDVNIDATLEGGGSLAVSARMPVKRFVRPSRLSWADFERLSIRTERFDVARYGAFLKSEVKKKDAGVLTPRLEDGVVAGEFQMDRRSDKDGPAGEGMLTFSSMLFLNEEAEHKTLTTKPFAARLVVQDDKVSFDPPVQIKTSAGALGVEGGMDLSRERIFSAPLLLRASTDGSETLNLFLARFLNCDPKVKKSQFRVSGTISRRRCDAM